MNAKNDVPDQCEELNIHAKAVSDISDNINDTYIASYHCRYGTIFFAARKASRLICNPSNCYAVASVIMNILFQHLKGFLNYDYYTYEHCTICSICSSTKVRTKLRPANAGVLQATTSCHVLHAADTYRRVRNDRR